MTQLEIRNVKKSFGDLEVLKNISFMVQYGDRIGIVGANGSGKSTLLNLIQDMDEANDGYIYINKNCSIQLMEQDAGLQKISDTNYQTDEYGEKQKYLKMFGMDASNNDLNVLSGGEQTKLVLSDVLSKKPTLLLLDEPTNNLDYYGINKLVGVLNLYSGSIIVVSHDRYFLDQIVDRIIEIEDGVSTEYKGNYTQYKIEKNKRFDDQMHQYEESKKRQKHIEDSIIQMKQWSNKAHQNSTKPDLSGVKMGAKEKKRVKAKKMDKRMKNYVKRLEKMQEDEVKRPVEEKSVRFDLENAEVQGKHIINAENIKKNYGEKVLFEKSSFFIERGEKIAVFGSNGCGKSTLIKLIQGKIQLDEGELWISPSYYPFILEQTFTDYDTKFTVLQYLTKKYGTISGLSRIILNNMGLSARHMEQVTSTLSYGEQMKLKLAEAILDQKNFIILDEPTNHLDLKSREMMEKTLTDYQGTLFIVSHDIYFLKKICNKVLYFENNRVLRSEYHFSQFISKKFSG